ncbi:MAG: DUF3307 domain-containing protein [Ignavibacteriales bacterium]|nr:DUF3307 domain-containing protein [Ignavibacteriales bacterium]
MNSILIQILIPLLTAHFLADFILQTDEDVKKKQSPLVFGKHIVLVTLLSYFLVGDWSNYIIPSSILLTHSIIDLLKNAIKKDSLFIFSIDQTAHYLVILLLSFSIQNKLFQEANNLFWFAAFGNTYIKVLMIVVAVIVITKFSSIIISYIIKPFQLKIFKGENNNKDEIKTGRIIGYLERIIILVLFLAELPAVVGFLITAKSILRYAEIKNEKDKVMVEYVLIGTLLSFTIGISIAFITSKILVYLG